MWRAAATWFTNSAHMQRALLVMPAVYLALLPTSWATAGRSIAFALSACLVLLDIALRAGHVDEPVRSPGTPIMLALCAWLGWAVASIAWSVRPDYTLGELRAEVAWGVITMGIFFYVVGSDPRAWRTFVCTLLGTFGLLTVVAIVLAASVSGWDPAAWHAGAGAFSTYTVLVAPFLFTLLAPPLAGLWTTRRSTVLALALLALLLVAARLSENRMVWIALAGSFATGYGLASARWPGVSRAAMIRRLTPLITLFLVIALSFADVAQERANEQSPVQASMMQSFGADPRFALWSFAAKRISERPWTGYGFGKSILQDEIRGAAHNPALTHPHNLFANQWLQLGAVGLSVFVALIATISWRFLTFLHASDDALAMTGMIGLAMLVGFLLKNLTDDFLVRSNAKEFWALTAMLLGYGARLERTTKR